MYSSLPFPETSAWFTLKLLVFSLLLENYDTDADLLETIWEEFQDSEHVSLLNCRMISVMSKYTQFPSLFTIAQEFAPEIIEILKTVTIDQDELMIDGSESCGETQVYFSLHSWDYAFFEKHLKRNVYSARCTPFSQLSGHCRHHRTDVFSDVVKTEKSIRFPFNEVDWHRLFELERGSDGDVEAFVWKQLGHSLRQHAVATQAAVIGRELGLSDYVVAEVVQTVQLPYKLQQIVTNAHLLPGIVDHPEDPRKVEHMLDRAYGYLMQHSPRTAELWVRSHFTGVLEEELYTLASSSFCTFPLLTAVGISRLSLVSVSPSTSSDVSLITPGESRTSLVVHDVEKCQLEPTNQVA